MDVGCACPSVAPLRTAPCRQRRPSAGFLLVPAVPGMVRGPSQWFLGRGTTTIGHHLSAPQVSTAEVADAASYMCVAENPAGSVEKLFTLRVQGELGRAGGPPRAPQLGRGWCSGPTPPALGQAQHRVPP